MWRASGAGEAYMYVPEGYQGADFCTQPPYTKCDYASGALTGAGGLGVLELGGGVAGEEGLLMPCRAPSQHKGL